MKNPKNVQHPIKLNRRDFLRLTGLAAGGVLLNACQQAVSTPIAGLTPTNVSTAIPPPSPTIPPTSVPVTPTFTATSTLTPSATPSPSSTASPTQTLTPSPTSTPTPAPTATPAPPTLGELARKLGMDIGASLYDSQEYLKNSACRNALSNFSMITDGGASHPYWTDLRKKEGFANLKQLSQFAKEHNMSFSLDHLFYPWSHFGENSPIHDMINASKEDFEQWMQARTEWFFAVPYFTALNFANEAIVSNTETLNYGWSTDGNPLYNLYGENWPEVTYKLAWNEAVKTGRIVGQDVFLIYNTATAETNTPGAEFEYQYLLNLKSKLSQELGVEKPFDIGMQFHTRTVSLDESICYGAHKNELEKNALIERFRKFGQIGNIRITEFSIAGTEDIEEQKDILRTVIEASIESGVCKSFMMWEPFAIFSEGSTCRMRNLFDQSFKPLFMFDELYRIFESYSK